MFCFSPSTLSLLWDPASQHDLSGTVPQCLPAWDGGWRGPLLFCSSLGPSDPGCLSLVWEASSETLHLLFMPIALNGVFASLVLKGFVPPPKNRRPLMLFVQELRPPNGFLPFTRDEVFSSLLSSRDAVGCLLCHQGDRLAASLLTSQGLHFVG